jgi:gamma-glutamyltranspeptidase
MTITRRSFLYGSAAAAAVVAGGIPAARAQAQTRIKYTLPWIPHGGYTHVFVTKKLGYWEKRGLDVSIDRGFGSGVVVPGTGVVLQNRGRSFTLDPSHPGCLAPGKRPFHTLMAAILTRDERPVAAFATMGGNGQAMFHAQVLTNLIDYGMDIQEAIERSAIVVVPSMVSVFATMRPNASRE